MWKDDSVRMHHMLDAAREAMSFAQNKSRKSLDTDRKLVLALIKSIEIIGEAAANVTKESQNKYSHIPWQNIIGMRNRLIMHILTSIWIFSGKPLPKIFHL